MPQKLGSCISDVELNDYLEGTLTPDKRTSVEVHLKECSECLDKLRFSYETVRDFSSKKGDIKMTKNSKNNLWLLGAGIFFLFSFLVPRYFMQFLVGTVLLGVKWIFESVNAKILIMIYEAWKKGGEKEASKVLGKLEDRF